MSEPLQVSESVTVPEAELSWRFSRSSGPGGQHVNTTDTRVELCINIATTSALSASQRTRALERLGGRLNDGVLVVSSSQHRSQWRNRQDAVERAADVIRSAIAPPPRQRRATKPSKRAKQKRLDAKKQRGNIKRLRGNNFD